MSRIKRIGVTLMVAGALLNIAPVATAAEVEATEHCFIIDPIDPVVCFVICVRDNQSVKACVDVTCSPNLPTVCFVLGEVWDIVP